MTHLFKRKKSHEKMDNPLLIELNQFNNNLKQRFTVQAEDTTSTSSCASFFSCIKTVSSKIPQEYKDIASWLTKLSTTQAKGDFNQAVLVSALYASLHYVSQDTVNSEIPAQLIKELIEEIASQFNLDLSMEPDYSLLRDYCMAHSIIIPEAINAVMAANQLANLIA